MLGHMVDGSGRHTLNDGTGKKFLFLVLYAGCFSRAAFESLRMKPFLQFIPSPLAWAMLCATQLIATFPTLRMCQTVPRSTPDPDPDPGNSSLEIGNPP